MSFNSKRGVIITLFAAGSLLFAASCKHTPDYNQMKKQVLDLHDKVMADGGKAEGDEMQFDLLLKSGLKQLKIDQPSLDTAAVRAQLLLLNKKLGNADDRMENWMHVYNNEFKGKTDQETLDYFTAEKLKIEKLDSLYKDALKPSADYLKKLNIKADTGMGKMKM
jgi:hypothetical protein